MSPPLVQNPITIYPPEKYFEAIRRLRRASRLLGQIELDSLNHVGFSAEVNVDEALRIFEDFGPTVPDESDGHDRGDGCIFGNPKHAFDITCRKCIQG